AKACPRDLAEGREGTRLANHRVWYNAPRCRRASVDTDRSARPPTTSRAGLPISLRLFPPLPTPSESRCRPSVSPGGLLAVQACIGLYRSRTRSCRRGLQTGRLSL